MTVSCVSRLAWRVGDGLGYENAETAAGLNRNAHNRNILTVSTANPRSRETWPDVQCRQDRRGACADGAA